MDLLYLCRNRFKKNWVNYFFARTISKLVEFTPSASTNIPSKRELWIMSANFLAIYCASIPRSSSIDSPPLLDRVGLSTDTRYCTYIKYNKNILQDTILIQITYLRISPTLFIIKSAVNNACVLNISLSCSVMHLFSIEHV